MISDTVKDFLALPPARWRDRVDIWLQDGTTGMDDVIRELDSIIQGAARLRGYLDARYGHGCGDQGHDDGAKQANKLVAHVRRPLGFTYPGRGDLKVLNFGAAEWWDTGRRLLGRSIRPKGSRGLYLVDADNQVRILTAP